MNKLIYLLVFLLGYASTFSKEKETDPEVVLESLYLEMHAVRAVFWEEKQGLLEEILKLKLRLSEFGRVNKSYVRCFMELERKKSQLVALEAEEEQSISKLRFVKGVEIMKSLYEKVLSLDHHFSTVRTFQEISNLSNPNSYPEFLKLNEHLKKKQDKKLGIQLTDVLGTNLFASVTQTLLNLSTGQFSDGEKEEELKKIECIMDFTLRMHNDLNTVYFETKFLQSSNDEIKESIETLFRDYTKPVKYYTALKECREMDDWGVLRRNLNDYLDEMSAESDAQSQLRMQIDLEFSIDRLMQFVEQYNDFIVQGSKFYTKFSIILNSYENEARCSESIPIEYAKLKQDIDLAIEKFEIAYRPVEINGSKMKEILYGINEYD